MSLLVMASAFGIGSMASLASYGAPDPRQKLIFALIGICCWIVLLIVANAALEPQSQDQADLG